MKAIRIQKPGGLDRLEMQDIDEPKPRAGEILVKARASSINFHDYLVASGAAPTEEGRIPMSDLAGEVVATGEGVTEFSVGDPVMSTFFPQWHAGRPAYAYCWGHIPGDTAEGYAREFVTAPEKAFTRVPEGYSLEEAGTLPCAALTAWRALFVEGGLQPGETVLVQGTGGVSVFALQFAKAAGAKVIATSSSDAKLERMKALGAEHLINYRQTPEWGKAAAALCPNGGVDHVIDISGASNLGQSFAACRDAAHVALIGVLAGMAGEVPTAAMMLKQLRVKGITVGSREHQLDMVAGIEAIGLRPVIDSSFPFTDLAGAFRYQETGQHFGKIGLHW